MFGWRTSHTYTGIWKNKQDFRSLKKSLKSSFQAEDFVHLYFLFWCQIVFIVTVCSLQIGQHFLTLGFISPPGALACFWKSLMLFCVFLWPKMHCVDKSVGPHLFEWVRLWNFWLPRYFKINSGTHSRSVTYSYRVGSLSAEAHSV